MKTRSKSRLGLSVLFLLSMVLVLPGIAAQDAQNGGQKEDEFVPPHDLEQGWYARIETSMGRILARLLPDQAPQSVAHFAAMAEGRLEWTDATGETHRGNYYDDTLIHKAVAGRRIEAGDRSGTGRGAPRIYVPVDEGAFPYNFASPGRLGMTRGSGGKISAVQFFVTASGQPWLNGKHPCFGIVVSDLELVYAISSVKTYSNGKPIKPVKIERVRIFKVGNPAPLPEPEPYQPTLRQFGPSDRIKDRVEGK